MLWRAVQGYGIDQRWVALEDIRQKRIWRTSPGLKSRGCMHITQLIVNWRTPNPCVMCNEKVKFGNLWDKAKSVGAEFIATGHYARVRLNEATGLHELLKGLDNSKDQSYFLHRLNQAQLSKTLFPVGELLKTQVRQIAEEIGLPNAKKKDSTGICFIGERPFREFLNRYIANEPGPIKDERGRKIGTHVGLSFYTLGQRQGLGIGGLKEKGAQRGGGDQACGAGAG